MDFNIGVDSPRAATNRQINYTILKVMWDSIRGNLNKRLNTQEQSERTRYMLEIRDLKEELKTTTSSLNESKKTQKKTKEMLQKEKDSNKKDELRKQVVDIEDSVKVDLEAERRVQQQLSVLQRKYDKLNSLDIGLYAACDINDYNYKKLSQGVYSQELVDKVANRLSTSTGIKKQVFTGISVIFIPQLFDDVLQILDNPNTKKEAQKLYLKHWDTYFSKPKEEATTERNIRSYARAQELIDYAALLQLGRDEQICYRLWHFIKTGKAVVAFTPERLQTILDNCTFEDLVRFGGNNSLEKYRETLMKHLKLVEAIILCKDNINWVKLREVMAEEREEPIEDALE